MERKWSGEEEEIWFWRGKSDLQTKCSDCNLLPHDLCLTVIALKLTSLLPDYFAVISVADGEGREEDGGKQEW